MMLGAEQYAGTVLIVEDDPATRERLAAWLDEAGFATVSVGRGQPALAALARRRFDALIIGQGLPDVSGLRICTAARERYGSVPVVVLLSADPYIDREVRALDLGVDAVIGKSWASDVLVACIRAKLRRTWGLWAVAPAERPPLRTKGSRVSQAAS
jgi:DNA-binding response OmpR family regulator